MRSLLGFSAVIGLFVAPAVTSADFKQASQRLHSATVTVKVIPDKAKLDDGGGDVADRGALAEVEEVAELPARSVAVCSGASLGDGLVVTYADISANDEIRITIPGGEQARAQLKVLDHVSGLTLLEIDKKDVPGLSSADEMPDVGSWVLSAAGWGSEKPVVSFGILAGTNRTLRGATFPPLLQCDLRTADTSNGAPLVNEQGELLGVVVASDAPGAENRWTYAVPVSHVQRLVRARLPHKRVQLHRRRPIVGLKLGAGDAPGTVVVQRVESGGPAARAGVQKGDEVLAADGTKIRSVYEVIRPLLAKQPGDKMTFLLQQSSGQRQIEVVLGGGTIIRESPSYTAASKVAPAGVVQIRELGIPPKVFNVSNDAYRAASNAAASTTGQQIDILQRAVDRYGVALETLQSELNRRDEELRKRDAQIEQLREKLEAAQQADPQDAQEATAR